ncbi:MAG: DivIVA domain-containing protein [Geobacter sp.]|jgi:cell division initiation protein|uniref:DivIVA domain-containing protein n=1 Tax=Trichlorobacter sp. TaxID=2911007 RepID=UPI002A360015|nr:DivIVA domain-containing protein [Trichlorobacter sp.]MDY0384216.1 DivIVA domain-containing protein [Trichlorobacter sp.]
MTITPLDIQQQQFKGKMFGGLDADDVDAFLQAVAAEMETLLRENTELKEQVNRQTRELSEMAERDKELRETMLAARTITEEMKANTQKEGELIIAEAQMQARRMVDDAERTVAELQVKVQDVRRQRLQFEIELKGLLDAHARLIEHGRQD